VSGAPEGYTSPLVIARGSATKRRGWQALDQFSQGSFPVSPIQP